MKRYLGWILLSGLVLASCSTTQKNTAAIKALLDREAATWRAGDVQAHASCWVIRPYSTILVSTADGKCFEVPPDLMIHPSASSMGHGGTSTRSNYKFSIHGKAAWVSHDEVSESPDGKKSYSHEIRMLEKVHHQWKLVGQSIQLYVPEK